MFVKTVRNARIEKRAKINFRLCNFTLKEKKERKQRPFLFGFRLNKCTHIFMTIIYTIRAVGTTSQLEFLPLISV